MTKVEETREAFTVAALAYMDASQAPAARVAALMFLSGNNMRAYKAHVAALEEAEGGRDD